jgi:hypothetical protein
MHKIISCLLSIATLICAHLPAQAQKPFTFFALGDMPYHNPEDLNKFEQLAARINTENPAFTIHVGDIKSGKTPCSDDYYNTILNVFNQFKGPLIYTPGDNEWTDCHTPAAGGYDPQERLAALRKLFFNKDQSLGQKPMPLISQRKVSGFETFSENAMWRKEGILFSTVHVVGSDNNFKPDASSNDEFVKRNDANVYWLKEAFKTATANKDAAIVVIMHAALSYKTVDNAPFNTIVELLRSEVKAFQKPVLLIYGGHHYFMINKPLRDAGDKLIPNYTALMVYGDYDMHAVRIAVNPKSASVFSFSEFIVAYR